MAENGSGGNELDNKKKGKPKVLWSEEEHYKFEEGLELYGRNWVAVRNYYIFFCYIRWLFYIIFLKYICIFKCMYLIF